MKILTVTRKQDLLEHRLAIEELFFNSFGQRAIGSVWEWAYLDNPNGEPVVSLCYDVDRLVGHYAIVPMPLSSGNVRKQSYISMTTMVAESHRKFGLFTQLAQENYRIAAEGGADFVFGFPNSQSTPGFRKRLDWTLPESDYVATVDKATLLAAAKAGSFDKTELLSLELNDPLIRAWRLSRPGATYTFDHGIAFKRHQDAVDLLWWENSEDFISLPDDASFNVLVSASSGLEPNRLFDYQFGGIGLRSSFDAAAINREMAISDLF
ncbi:GNAT family N-acetyltransferase [Undibacterium sp. CY7W]|uniref:GNAT family N-acetyltransferase n=1 Tax=Undibacterium rugosum TaxID=2762291 RepID=A0A923I214_9BURK|nr:GNAT family N-acetyltransferase [Undibacterium rugosum]MBC3936359.1 GNAT family N-acetyltransferase [Undibacterium rugosum]